MAKNNKTTKKELELLLSNAMAELQDAKMAAIAAEDAAREVEATAAVAGMRKGLLPRYAVPCLVLSCHAMPCHAMPCLFHALPCLAMTCLVLSCVLTCFLLSFFQW
jgi:hypothetical protein